VFKRQKTYSDQEIIALIKNAESNQVLNFLYKTVQPKVTGWIIKNSGNNDDAQDVFQDAVLSFYNYVLDDKFDATKSVTAFIFSSAKNMWINRVKLVNRESGELPYQVPDVSEKIDISEENEMKISSLLAELGARCEELLTYSVFYKMSMEDIALRMGFSNANAAKTKNYKCKQRLVLLVKDKKGLKDYLFDE
jgi:RNA polymerase sigma factor (sigma-70 family)